MDSDNETEVQVLRKLVALKDRGEIKTWKEFQSRYEIDTGKYHGIAALQMKAHRFRKQQAMLGRSWTQPDVQALQDAHDYYIREKFAIIANQVFRLNLEN